MAAETSAKAAKKVLHSDKECKKETVNAVVDPRKIKAYAGALQSRR